MCSSRVCSVRRDRDPSVVQTSLSRNADATNFTLKSSKWPTTRDEILCSLSARAWFTQRKDVGTSHDKRFKIVVSIALSVNVELTWLPTHPQVADRLKNILDTNKYHVSSVCEESHSVQGNCCTTRGMISSTVHDLLLLIRAPSRVSSFPHGETAVEAVWSAYLDNHLYPATARWLLAAFER